MISRADGLSFLNDKLQNINLQRHCLAVEAIMRGLADHFGEDRELWGLSGLMHDIDYELTKDNMSRHSLISAGWLEEKGYPVEVVRAVKVHNELHGVPPETRMERALIYADAISGLLVAAALIKPSKKIAEVSVQNIMKRFKEKDFARGVHRELILKCEADDLTLEEFSEISLHALQRAAAQIGL